MVAELVHLAQQALMLSVVVSLPVLGVATLVTLVVAVVQAMTQVHDPSVAHLPRMVAVAVALAAAGPWMGSQIAAFASRAFLGG